jgi:hypothetical protein
VLNHHAGFADSRNLRAKGNGNPPLEVAGRSGFNLCRQQVSFKAPRSKLFHALVSQGRSQGELA